MTGGKKTAILISGRGSNLASLITACDVEDYPAEAALVISNRPRAPGLRFARDAGIETASIDHTKFASREAFDAEIDRTLKANEIELVCLAGFMRLLGTEFVESWRNRLINIHPSLLPAYPGVNTHERVIADGARISGCTVHFVRTGMDSGPIIAQAAVPVLSGDTANSLAERVLGVEHRIYPFALRMVADGTVRVSGERVVFAGRDAGSEPLFSPPLE